jgi:hypothetical protein
MQGHCNGLVVERHQLADSDGIDHLVSKNRIGAAPTALSRDDPWGLGQGDAGEVVLGAHVEEDGDPGPQAGQRRREILNGVSPLVEGLVDDVEDGSEDLCFSAGEVVVQGDGSFCSWALNTGSHPPAGR